jgi:hypothetical protein
VDVFPPTFQSQQLPHLVRHAHPLLGSFPDLSLVPYCLLSLESERAGQSGNASDVFPWRARFESGTWPRFSWVYRDFPQSIQPNAAVILQVRPRPLPSTYFPNFKSSLHPTLYYLS